MSFARPMIAGTLARYFGLRFLQATVLTFGGIFLLIALIDYIELMRHSADRNVSAWLVARTSLYRVPQLAERVLPFTVLIAAMTSFLALSRRLELVVARAAGVSAWQFIAPALLLAAFIGALTTMLYNPIAAALQEKSKRLELQISGNFPQSGLQATQSGFWLRQRSPDGQAIIHAVSSSAQGLALGSVTVFAFDPDGTYRERIEARTAKLKDGLWELTDARIYGENVPPVDRDIHQLRTNLTAAQVRESFATPEAVSFWDLPLYISTAENSGLKAAGYRLQYQKTQCRTVPGTVSSPQG